MSKLFNIVKNRFSNRYLSAWTILTFDVILVFFLFYLSVFLRLNFALKGIDETKLLASAILVSVIYLISFLFFKPYSGILRQVGLNDAIKIFRATTYSFAILLFIVIINKSFLKGYDLFSKIQFSTVIIHYVISFFVLTGARFIIKNVYKWSFLAKGEQGCHVLIFGSGLTGLITLHSLQQNEKKRYKIIAFLDDNAKKVGKNLEGIQILAPSDALNEKFIKKHRIDRLVIAVLNLNMSRKQKLVDQALLLGLQIKIVPPMEDWTSNNLTSQQLREIKIEDLLGRDPIKLDNENVVREIEGKVVMVTGAAGSIGSEIVRQVLCHNPLQVILLDQAESPLYELQLELRDSQQHKQFFNRIVCVVANIKDKIRMEMVFRLYKPQLIYHAAAYKHVPLMEDYPYEALMVNVFGTKNLVDLSLKYAVKKFVMISTDKAVNPTNVMGASKRIAEIYAQSHSGNKSTYFITTRFGNVLGSNGSVVPIFKKQISEGGPVKITHKDITRFFMTISEACSLVLEAGTMGKGGEIFIFDMGESVRIYDLAERMVRLSGFIPEKDIEIIETGLRPGEKLYEELLTKEENVLATYHPKIMRAKIQKHDIEFVDKFYQELYDALMSCDETRIVTKMKEIVPEYISNNSVYCSLDKSR